MTQKLGNLLSWTLLQEGNSPQFPAPHDDSRTVRLRVNAPCYVNLYVTPCEEYIDAETGELTFKRVGDQLFLAAVLPGLDVIEFVYAGAFCLDVSGGNCYFDTVDGTWAAVEPFDETSFTRIREREERDPAIMAMELKMRQRMEQRMAAMAEQQEIMLQNMEARFEASRTSTETVISQGGTSGVQEPPVPAGTVPPPPPAGGGENG